MRLKDEILALSAHADRIARLQDEMLLTLRELDEDDAQQLASVAREQVNVYSQRKLATLFNENE